MERRGSRTFYFDLKKEVAKQRVGQTAFTPAVTLVDTLHTSTRVFLEQGLDHIVKEAALMARCTRAGFQALGFSLLSKQPANAVTAVLPPEGIDAGDLARRLQTSYGIKVAGGQGHLKGRIIRIAHLGYFDVLDVVTVLSGVELCLAEMGVSAQIGLGVQAALSVASESSSTAATTEVGA